MSKGARAALATCSALAMALPGVARAYPPCLILGDSIAQGASAYAPECQSLAKQGIASRGWSQEFAGIPLIAPKVLISLGTNDGEAKTTRADLLLIRSRIHAREIIWIAPGERFAARRDVIAIAHALGDSIYERPVENLAADGIHFRPEGYARIGAAARP